MNCRGREAGARLVGGEGGKGYFGGKGRKGGGSSIRCHRQPAITFYYLKTEVIEVNVHPVKIMTDAECFKINF